MIGQHQSERVAEFFALFALDIFLKAAAIASDLAEMGVNKK